MSASYGRVPQPRSTTAPASSGRFARTLSLTSFLMSQLCASRFSGCMVTRVDYRRRTMPDTTVRFHYRPLPQPLRASRWFARPRPYALAGPAQDHLIQRIDRFGSFYEADLLEALDTALGGAKGTIIDVGANLGNHSVYFAAVIGA